MCQMFPLNDKWILYPFNFLYSYFSFSLHKVMYKTLISMVINRVLVIKFLSMSFKTKCHNGALSRLDKYISDCVIYFLFSLAHCVSNPRLELHVHTAYSWPDVNGTAVVTISTPKCVHQENIRPWVFVFCFCPFALVVSRWI